MPELARQRADGVIDRSKTRDIPIEPLAIYEVALVFGAHVAETILASVHVRAHFTGRTYGRNDLIKSCTEACEEGAVNIWFYGDLNAYCADPTSRRRTELRARFD